MSSGAARTSRARLCRRASLADRALFPASLFLTALNENAGLAVSESQSGFFGRASVFRALSLYETNALCALVLFFKSRSFEADGALLVGDSLGAGFGDFESVAFQIKMRISLSRETFFSIE